jgi:hypothetical protein
MKMKIKCALIMLVFCVVMVYEWADFHEFTANRLYWKGVIS